MSKHEVAEIFEHARSQDDWDVKAQVKPEAEHVEENGWTEQKQRCPVQEAIITTTSKGVELGYS